MHRIAFDPNLPVVAAQSFEAKGERFAAGSVVDWKRLGISEMVLRDWWLACLVVHPLPTKTVVMLVTPGERVEIKPPPPTPTPPTGKRRERR